MKKTSTITPLLVTLLLATSLAGCNSPATLPIEGEGQQATVPVRRGCFSFLAGLFRGASRNDQQQAAGAVVQASGSSQEKENQADSQKEKSKIALKKSLKKLTEIMGEDPDEEAEK